ncbi:MAG: hypothetical protein V4574_03405 [Pseudomonadota bacterium]
MAGGSFKGLGWFLCGVVVAPACYIVTSQGAAERQRLHMVETRIAEAKKNIRDLETEFQTRANLSQIERWNGEVLALSAPVPQQFASDTQLASLDAADMGDARLETLVTPAGAPKLAPQPAVDKHGATATAQNVSPGAGKTAIRTVAMLDDRLLSASTMSDLERAAASEKLALR